MLGVFSKGSLSHSSRSATAASTGSPLPAAPGQSSIRAACSNLKDLSSNASFASSFPTVPFPASRHTLFAPWRAPTPNSRVAASRRLAVSADGPWLGRTRWPPPFLDRLHCGWRTSCITQERDRKARSASPVTATLHDWDGLSSTILTVRCSARFSYDSIYRLSVSVSRMPATASTSHMDKSHVQPPAAFAADSCMIPRCTCHGANRTTRPASHDLHLRQTRLLASRNSLSRPRTCRDPPTLQRRHAPKRTVN